MPKKAPEEPKPLNFATPNPWSALPRDVHVGTGHGKKEGATTESPVDGQDQPKIYTIRDHTLEVLMHPDVLELHAVRVVHTPHGDERQLHLKVRVRCGREEKVVDVLVDTGAQVSLVRRGLFKEEFLQPSRRPVGLKVANGEIMGGGTHEATISMEFWEHERLNRPDQAKRSTLSGNFYVADITYDFSSCFFPKFRKSPKRGFSREMTYFFLVSTAPKIGGGGPPTQILSKNIKNPEIWPILGYFCLLWAGPAKQCCTPVYLPIEDFRQKFQFSLDSLAPK